MRSSQYIERREADQTLALACFFFLMIGFAIAFTISGLNQTRIEQCHEDQSLVGAGDYEHGYFDSYVCGPAVDDYIREGASSDIYVYPYTYPYPEK